MRPPLTSLLLPPHSTRTLFLRAVEACGDDGATLTALGLLHVQARNGTRAEACFERAIKCDPTSPEPRLALATLYEGRVKNAVPLKGGSVLADSSYRQALQADPDHVPTLLRYPPSPVRAISRLRAPRHMLPAWLPLTLPLVARHVWRLPGPQQAQQVARGRVLRARHFRGAVQSGVPLPLRAVLARACAHAGTRARCCGAAGVCTNTRPSQHVAGDSDQARAHYIRTLALDSRHAMAHYHLGELAEAACDYATAEENYLRALDMGPEAPRPMYALLLRKVRQAYQAAEEAFMRGNAPGDTEEQTKSLILHQRLHKYATLKTLYASRLAGEPAGGGKGVDYFGDRDLSLLADTSLTSTSAGSAYATGTFATVEQQTLNDPMGMGTLAAAGIDSTSRWHQRPYFAAFRRYRDRLTFAEGDAVYADNVAESLSRSLELSGAASTSLLGGSLAAAEGVDGDGDAAVSPRARRRDAAAWAAPGTKGARGTPAMVSPPAMRQRGGGGSSWPLWHDDPEDGGMARSASMGGMAGRSGGSKRGPSRLSRAPHTPKLQSGNQWSPSSATPPTRLRMRATTQHGAGGGVKLPAVGGRHSVSARGLPFG